VEEEAISFLPGVMRGVHMVAHAIGRKGDGILVQPPVYYPFFDVPPNSQRVLQLVEIPQVDGHYEVDFDAFEAAITDQTCLFLLCNPHNPIGRAFTPEDLHRMAEICLRHDLVICSDEIHSDLVFSEAKHTPIASLDPEIARRTVTCFAPSKTFNIPGLACSVMVIEDPELREAVQAAAAGLVRGSNMMGYTAALAAYRDGEEWLEALLRYLQANRDYLLNYVQDRLPGVEMTKPEATFLAWLDCRDAGIPKALSPHDFFLEQAGVALNKGATFGPGGQGFVRLNFGCPRATLQKALERMKDALTNHRSL
jgi:cystathionine beta-lyase